MDKLKSRLEQIDRDLREARFSQALLEFQPLTRQKWPRESLLELCQIARRLNLPYTIVKWLHPVVRPQTELIAPATEAEQSLYAVGLTRIGAFSEAEELLKGLSGDAPDMHFALGLLYMGQWKYAQALRPFRRYLKHFSPTTYPALIGHLNLMAALVHCSRIEEARALGEKLLEQTAQGSFPLLRANTLEVLAQSYDAQDRFREMQDCLNEAASILKNSGSNYELFVYKWKLILKLKMQKTMAPTEEVSALKEMARTRSSYETLRELDFYEALTTGNKSLFYKVYFGTRFPHYRKKMKEKFGFQGTVPQSFLCPFGDSNSGEEEVLTVSHLPIPVTSAHLLNIVLSDFYRPIQLGEVFKELYPDEYLNPETSLRRLYQAFHRLKAATHNLSLPFRLQWSQRQLHWQPVRGFHLNLGPARTTAKPHLAPDLSIFKQPTFSVQDLMRGLQVSRASANRLVTKALRAREIKRLRPGHFKKVS